MSSRSRPSNTQSSSSRSVAPPAPPISYLFIVNELATNDNPEYEGSVEARYINGRWRPPTKIQGFIAQEPGTVYRWFDGRVSRADEYHWDRGQVGDPVDADRFADGSIRRTEYPQYPVVRYRAATVFYCDTFDPFFTARGDASVRNFRDYGPEDEWHPLTFRHDRNISRAEHAGNHQHTKVRSADWIGQLIPKRYRASSNSTTSGGLAGLLPLVISFVAFSCRNRGELDQILINDRAWSGHRWNGHQRETGRIERRGVVTTVYLDPDNPGGSNWETLDDIEYGSTPIFR